MGNLYVLQYHFRKLSFVNIGFDIRHFVLVNANDNAKVNGFQIIYATRKSGNSFAFCRFN